MLTPRELPLALRERSAEPVPIFEIDLHRFRDLLIPANPIGMLVEIKLLRQSGTAALALHAQLPLSSMGAAMTLLLAKLVQLGIFSP